MNTETVPSLSQGDRLSLQTMMNTCSAHGERVLCIVTLPAAQCFTGRVQSRRANPKTRLKSTPANSLSALSRPECSQCTFITDIFVDQSSRPRAIRRHVAASARADAQPQSSENVRCVCLEHVQTLCGALILLATIIMALCHRGSAWHVV